MSADALPPPRRSVSLSRLLPSLVAGVVISVVDIPFEISVAALIFSGVLAPFVASGIGFLLAGVVVLVITIGGFSSYRGMVGLPQDSSAVIISVMAAAIAGQMAGAASEAIFLTVIAATTAASLLTGLAFLALGWFRLGDLIRYVPYPVIGGFLAGTGWLLAIGGLGVMTDLPSTAAALPQLFAPGLLLRWLPGLAFAVILVLATRRTSHFLVMPALIIGASALFFAALAVAGISIQEAGAMGLLLGPFPAGGLWQLPPFAALLEVNWLVVASQAGQYASLIVISTLSLLLNASGLELASRHEIDLNRELRSSGVANLGAGLVGSPPGFTALSLSSLARRMGANSRLVGVVIAGVAIAVLLAGAPLLGLFPRVLVGGLVLFMGLSFLADWVLDTRSTFSRADYLTVLAILVTIALFGPLAGVGLGIVLAVAQFIFEYSRTNAIKAEWDGVRYACRVERSARQHQALADHTDLIFILELQGFIFFGTANKLFERVRSRFRETSRPQPQFVILDFRRVTNVDASAVQSLIKISQVNDSQPPVLVFSQLAPAILQRLEREMAALGSGVVWHSFPNLDFSVEWCENQILQTVDQVLLAAVGNGVGTSLTAQEASQQWSGVSGEDAKHFPLDLLLPYLQRMELAQDEVLFHQGDLAPGLFYLESGQLTAVAEQPDSPPIRLRSMASGAVVGELSVYLQRPASASIIANMPSTVYLLPVEMIRQIDRDDPQVANELNRFLVQLLGRRVIENLEHVRTLAH